MSPCARDASTASSAAPPVSYTHLDVYKRQDISGVAHISRLLGLSAAVDTAAGASHDLNKVIIGFAGFHLFKQFFCIAKAGGHGKMCIRDSRDPAPGKCGYYQSFEAGPL